MTLTFASRSITQSMIRQAGLLHRQAVIVEVYMGTPKHRYKPFFQVSSANRVADKRLVHPGNNIHTLHSVGISISAPTLR